MRDRRKEEEEEEGRKKGEGRGRRGGNSHNCLLTIFHLARKQKQELMWDNLLTFSCFMCLRYRSSL